MKLNPDITRDPQVLEVIEGLLNLCVEREKEIAELAQEVRQLKLDNAELRGDDLLFVEPDYVELARRDVMVADGVELTRVEIRNVLENNGFTVVACAKDGRQAVELYKEKHPALVTIDTHLPMLDGYQATQRIREYDPDAKVIVISRARDRAMVLEAIMSGASDYICKPVQPERLLRSVNRLLAS
jgi:two-component system chemotaxis response regulator CheY